MFNTIVEDNFNPYTNLRRRKLVFLIKDKVVHTEERLQALRFNDLWIDIPTFAQVVNISSEDELKDWNVHK